MPLDGTLPNDVSPDFVGNFPPMGSFESWLFSYGIRTVFEPNWNAASCPIATWIRATTNIKYPLVTSIEWINENTADHMPRPLPQWARKFVFLVDKECMSGVTVARCLDIVRSIKRHPES